MELQNSGYTFHDSFEQIINSISLLKLQLTEVQQKIKQMEKNVKKELKNVDKINNKNKNSIKKTKLPSGFAKPTLVTNQLCEFMNRPIGTEIARTEVNKHLISYIKHNDLQDKTNKTIIIPDNKLKNLLGINLDSETEIPLTFFTIQKYMNQHFISNKNNNTNTILLHSNFC
jgi:chromatin remodeling complex protein RSC6